MENSKSTLRVLGAFVVGALAGTAIGVLYAPNKGTKTRENITGGTKKMAKDLKKRITKQLETLKREAMDLEKKAEDRLVEMKNEIEDSTREILER